jgi:transcriptional regulator with XRE-family HTH domain
MHLNELAEKVGVTKSCLSQIETGKAFPSIVTLKKIADQLESSIGELVGEKEQLAFNPLIKKNDRKFIKDNGKGTALYLLSHYDPNKQMETYFVQFEKDADVSGLIESNAGQTFCYIINGRIEIIHKNKEHVLKKGDCFYYNFNECQSIKNIDKDISRMIWVINHSVM